MRGRMAQEGFGIRPVVMTVIGAVGACLATMLAVAISSAPPPALPAVGEPAASAVASDYGKLPLSFEPNAGRTDGRADFISQGDGYASFTTHHGAVIRLGDGPRRSRVVRLGLVGANQSSSVAGLERLPGKVNSFIGNEPSRWRTGISTYERVRYSGVYPGVAVDWYGRQGRLEYDFRIAAGADPEAIALRVAGADSLRLTGNGDLLIGAGNRTIRQRAPVAYQASAGIRHFVNAGYRIDGDRVSFKLGAYDRAEPLVIDPQLIYSGVIGGNAFDNNAHIAVDSAGSAHVVGSTQSTDFPTTPGVEDETPPDGSSNAYALKLNSAGGLVYSTYLGGTAFDNADGIALDSSGRAVVAGDTSSPDFPVPAAYDSSHNGTTDGFLVRITSTGAVDYGTFIGGAGIDVAQDVAMTGADDALVAGRVAADLTDGTTAGAADTSRAADEGFLVRIDPDTPGIGGRTYASYTGGAGNDYATDIEVSDTGSAYVAGRTLSTDFPVTAGSMQSADPDNATVAGNAQDGYLVVDDMVGGPGFSYSTYIGGGGTVAGQGDIDEPGGIAIDGTQALVAGETDAEPGVGANFPISAGALRSTCSCPGNFSTDGYLVKIDPAGAGAADLVYGTYFGGSLPAAPFHEDQALDLALTSDHRALIVGRAEEVDDFPTTPERSSPANRSTAVWVLQ